MKILPNFLKYEIPFNLLITICIIKFLNEAKPSTLHGNSISLTLEFPEEAITLIS